MLLLALLALPTFPSAALAQGKDVIRDCAQDGDLDDDYSQEELDDAHDNLPSDIDAYTNCREVIEQARERNEADRDNDSGSDLGVAGSGGRPGGGGTSDGAGDLGGSRNDRTELRERQERSDSDRPPTASVAGEELTGPGPTLASDEESDGMPTSLLVAIILSVLATLGGLLYLFQDRLPESIGSRLPGSPQG